MSMDDGDWAVRRTGYRGGGRADPPGLEVIGSDGADTHHRRAAGCTDQRRGGAPPNDVDFYVHRFLSGLNGGDDTTDSALGGGAPAGGVVGFQILTLDYVNEAQRNTPAYCLVDSPQGGTQGNGRTVDANHYRWLCMRTVHRKLRALSARPPLLQAVR